MDGSKRPAHGAAARLAEVLLDTGRIRRAAAVIWMNVLVAAVLLAAVAVTGLLGPAATPLPVASWPVRAVSLFAIWLLSFVPGWLYIRFLGLRADALWSEYVLTLFRLGMDDPEHLPPPPAESVYARLPGAAAGGAERTNIYRQKFNAYYGRKVSARPDDPDDVRVSVETLFPIFLCTVTLAVAWTVILWDPGLLMSPLEPWATLEFGFLGAYAFAVSMLVRRFYQSDLRPSAYAAVVLRLVVVLLILAVIHQMFAIDPTATGVPRAAQYVTAFVVGFFPLAGLHALQRVAAKVLRVVLPQMAPEYPLEQLDGLNIWYQARLIEEGVEDMQNLTTMNLVDVILHTRAPVGRLIDWIDQAFLLIHLDHASRAELARARTGEGTPADGITRDGAATRVALRRIGIRSATDLLNAFGAGDGAPSSARAPITDATLRGQGLDPDQIRTIVSLLAADPGLNPLWNWKRGGAGRTSSWQASAAEVRPAARRRPATRGDSAGRVGRDVGGHPNGTGTGRAGTVLRVQP